MPRRHACILLALGMLACAGCATYTPLPLGNGMGASAARLGVPASSMPTQPLARHRFDPSDGLDVIEVAMLAVANNPQLRVERDTLGIARAQAFAAGLLPDPEVGVGVDFPTSSGNGLTKAFDLGLTEDIGAFLTRSARTAAAGASARQVNLELLWAEWQTIARARELFGEVRGTGTRERLLRREVRALEPLQKAINAAWKAGNLTWAGASAGLNALADARNQLAEAVRLRSKAVHDLHLLLGLSPGVGLHLVGSIWHAKPTTAQVRHALATLPQRRPDLLALKAGYAAQEARLRGAILDQFPSITLGFTRARDTSDVYTSGFNIGITLPLFNRNRGNIAIARATRQRLHDAYASRLLTTRIDMDRLQHDLYSLHAQISAAGAQARRLDAARHAAAHAWKAGTLDWPTYLAIRGNALTADLRVLSLREQRAHQSIALETLLGGDWTRTQAGQPIADAPVPSRKPER